MTYLTFLFLMHIPWFYRSCATNIQQQQQLGPKASSTVAVDCWWGVEKRVVGEELCLPGLGCFECWLRKWGVVRKVGSGGRGGGCCFVQKSHALFQIISWVLYINMYIFIMYNYSYVHNYQIIFRQIFHIHYLQIIVLYSL